MANYLIEIALCIILGLLYYLASPVILFIGKYVLKALTLNKYPPENPNNKQIQAMLDIGLIASIIIVFIIFMIRNN